MSESALVPAVERAHARLVQVEGVHIETADIRSPSTEAEIENFLRSCECDIPDFLVEVYREEASGIVFSWSASASQFGSECRRGYLQLLCPDEVVSQFKGQKEQADEVRRSNLGVEEGYSALARDWPFWIPVFRFRSGDCFCVDVRDPEMRVVFLEHDVMDAGPNLHGMQLARNLGELILRWSEVGFVELFDWTTACTETGLDPTARILDGIRHRLASL
jgi:hypothetical protein